MRVAEDVSGLDLPEYQQAARTLLNNPLVTAVHPTPSALPLLRRWAPQLRRDLAEVLGYTLVATSDTMRLRRAQDTLDGTRPAISRTRRPFDRRRYAYLALTLSALGRSGTQIALSEMADAVAADAARVDGLGMDTGRKPDRDAFVDAVAWLEARGALRMADGSAVDWANDPDKAEALYDIDREVVGAVYQPSRVLQHLGSVAELLDTGSASSLAVGGKEAQRRTAARRARRMVLEQPVVYYADADESLRGQLRAPALAEDLERLTGLGLERRAEGVALVDLSRRLSDTAFPSGGTVQQSALLLCTRIAERVLADRGRIEQLPAATAAERLREAARRIDTALPEHGAVVRQVRADLGAGGAVDAEPAGDTAPEDTAAEAAYPFLSDAWLRGALRKLLAEFGSGMAEKQVGDPDRLLEDALALLAAMGLLARVDGGVLALPLLARYRGATVQVRNRPRAPLPEPQSPQQQTALFAVPGTTPETKDALA
jgi:uncharacterized protein (TIGR02678 family)